jgi:hypothetical protein
MSVDAGSINSEVRVKLSALNADIAACKTAFDNLGAEFGASAEKYSTLAGKRYVNALKTVQTEMANVEGAARAGALSESQAVTRLIELRQRELKILQDKAVKEGTASAETVNAIKKTETALSALEEKEKILSSGGQAGGGLLATFGVMRDAMLGPIAIIKEIIAVLGALKAKSDEMENAWAGQTEASSLLDAIIKQTGADAWTTREHLEEIAGSLQKLTKFGDEEIESMQGVLLGFRNIQGVNFDRATEDILDMATVMKMDLTSAAQVVGKALDNLDYDGLARQGFKFTEQEKAQMKAMKDSGDLVGAQVIIMKELEKTYGGASKAVGELDVNLKTKLKNAIGDVNEEIGRSISHTLAPFRERWLKIAEAVGAAVKAQNDFREAMDRTEAGTATVDDALTILNIRLSEWKKAQDEATDPAAIRMYQEYIDAGNKKLETQTKLAEKLAAVKNARDKKEQDAADSEFKKQKAIDDQAKLDLEIATARLELQKKYGEATAKINLDVKNGLMTEAQGREAIISAINSEIGGLEDLQLKYGKDTGANTQKRIEGQKAARDALVMAISEEDRALADNTALAEENANRVEEGAKSQEHAFVANVDATESVERMTAAIKDQISRLGGHKDKTENQAAALIELALSAGVSKEAIDALQAALDELENKLEQEKALKDWQSRVESTANSMIDIVNALTTVTTEAIDKQIEALDAQYAHQKELIENDGMTKREALAKQLEEAKAAGKNEVAVNLEKQIELLDAEKAYNKKKAALQYQADMAAWNAKKANAIVDAAQLVMNGLLTQPFPVGLVMGGIAAAAGAAQIIAIDAAKPTMPNAATGGIVIPKSGGVPINTAENGHRELLLNDGPEGSAFLEAFAERIVGAMGRASAEPIVIPLSLTVDGKVLAKVTARYFNDGLVVLK